MNEPDLTVELDAAEEIVMGRAEWWQPVTSARAMTAPSAPAGTAETENDSAQAAPVKEDEGP